MAVVGIGKVVLMMGIKRLAVVVVIMELGGTGDGVGVEKVVVVVVVVVVVGATKVVALEEIEKAVVQKIEKVVLVVEKVAFYGKGVMSKVF